MSTDSKNNGLTFWAIAAILGLLALNAFQWFTNNNISSKLAAQETEMMEVEKIQAELEQEYQLALESLEGLKNDNKELNDLIESQKKELTAQKEKINGLIWTQRELGKAREEIANLNNLAKGYVTEINKLKDENRFLASSNKQLTEEKALLAESYQKQQELNKELEEARKVLASEKQRLAKNNVTLSGQVDMANAIKINYLDVVGYEINKKGEFKKKSKAKDIEVIRTCVKTETNLVTPSGQKDFFVRLINPLGETVAIESNGSGVIENKLDGTKVRYSYSGSIDYNNEDTEACLDF